MDFDARALIHCDANAVWRRLWDIEGIARCIEGCQDVRTLEPEKRYAATVVERVGPFSVTIEMELSVEESDPGRRLAIEASGKEGKLGTRVRWRGDVALNPDGDSRTSLEVRLHAEVRGKIASLGEGLVKRKAQEGLQKFLAAFVKMAEGDA